MIMFMFFGVPYSVEAETVAVPGVNVDCSIIVACPLEVSLTVVPISVPSPDTLKYTSSCDTIPPQPSQTTAVTSEVDIPSAPIVVGLALTVSTQGEDKIQLFTSAVPSSNPSEVAITVAIPRFMPDRNVIVAIPSTASFVVVPNKLPGPDMLNVISLVAFVLILSL